MMFRQRQDFRDSRKIGGFQASEGRGEWEEQVEPRGFLGQGNDFVGY